MTKFEFYLSESDTNRLFAVKNAKGLGDLTGNEYARQLLERELHRLHPAVVEFDEDGMFD